MMRWFHALMPKEERFFDLFARHSQAVLAGAEALRAMLEGGAAVQRNYQIVMDREQDADDVTREVLIAVRRTFITPFDRGNIRDLITSMDNAIDQMQKTAKGVMLFDVTEFTPQMKEMADAIVKCAHLVQEAVPLLRSISSEAAHISYADRANLAARRPRRRIARYRPARTLSRPRARRIRWPSSSATKSTIIWRKSLTVSMTWPTSCTALSSSTSNRTARPIRRWMPPRSLCHSCSR